MDGRAELLKTRQQLRAAIISAEDWTESYKANPATFNELINLEAQLETNVAEYLHGLSIRAVDYVDWSRTPEPIKADAGPVANNDDPVWRAEEVLLTAAVLEIIEQLVATGAIAGEEFYGVTVGMGTLDEAIMRAARQHTAQLVKGVTDTSRKLIRESVAKSIAMGEDASQATLRLMDVIDNPIRAELIAQTEPVNAYQTGLKHYAMSTGAKQKTYDGIAGACRLCAPLIGKTIDIDEVFVLSNGREIDRPASHPRCRCGLIYIY